MSDLKDRLKSDVTSAMKAREKERLAVLRQLSAAIKQHEIDNQVELDDAGVSKVFDKMAKQRRESIEQFDKAGRDDLSAQERFELDVITAYLPQPLGEAEIAALIDKAIASTGASGMAAMGQVMAELKPDLAGRADMSAVSAIVRGKLAG